jgi:hypothetical protein
VYGADRETSASSIAGRVHGTATCGEREVETGRLRSSEMFIDAMTVVLAFQLAIEIRKRHSKVDRNNMRGSVLQKTVLYHYELFVSTREWNIVE